MIEKSIAWLGDDFPSETQMPVEESFHHDLLSETYEAIIHAIDAHGSESKEYLDACKIYGKKLLSYWASFMRSLQSQVAPKRRAKYELKVDKVRGEKTLEYEKLCPGGKRLYLRTTEGNFNSYIDSNPIPRMDIYMNSSISNPGLSTHDNVKMRILNGHIGDVQEVGSRKNNTSFKVVLFVGNIKTITKDTLLPGGVQDTRTITGPQGILDLMT